MLAEQLGSREPYLKRHCEQASKVQRLPRTNTSSSQNSSLGFTTTYICLPESHQIHRKMGQKLRPQSSSSSTFSPNSPKKHKLGPSHFVDWQLQGEKEYSSLFQIPHFRNEAQGLEMQLGDREPVQHVQGSAFNFQEKEKEADREGGEENNEVSKGYFS